MIATPCAASRRMTRKRCRPSLIVSDDVGSSRMSTFRLVREPLRDLDHLLLARRERSDRRARIDVDLEVGEDAARAVVHRRRGG